MTHPSYMNPSSRPRPYSKPLVLVAAVTPGLLQWPGRWRRGNHLETRGPALLEEDAQPQRNNSASLPGGVKGENWVLTLVIKKAINKYTPVIATHRKWRQELRKPEVSLDYIVRPSLFRKKKKKVIWRSIHINASYFKQETKFVQETSSVFFLYLFSWITYTSRPISAKGLGCPSLP
jgi:hypothetical protein